MKNNIKYPCLVKKYSKEFNKYYLVPEVNTFIVVKKGINPSGLMVILSDELIYTEKEYNKRLMRECWVKCYVFETNKIELLRANWYEECMFCWEEL